MLFVSSSCRDKKKNPFLLQLASVSYASISHNGSRFAFHPPNERASLLNPVTKWVYDQIRWSVYWVNGGKVDEQLLKLFSVIWIAMHNSSNLPTLQC